VFRLFSKKEEKPREDFDLSIYTPAIRSSICTGEKTAGFVEKSNGQFHDVMLIRNPSDLETFKKRYGINTEIKTIY
jgi:hypothetical protein